MRIIFTLSVHIRYVFQYFCSFDRANGLNPSFDVIRYVSNVFTFPASLLEHVGPGSHLMFKDTTFDKGLHLPYPGRSCMHIMYRGTHVDHSDRNVH